MDLNLLNKTSSRPEFVGTAAMDTIGLVIPGIDSELLEKMNIKKDYRALGVYSSRTGAAGQFTALDDAVKTTNTEVLSIELPRDTKGGAGHGNYVVLGSHDVSDVRSAIKKALELTDKYTGELYASDAGHLEFTYSASAGPVLQKALNAKPYQAFAFMAGAPAAIGLVMADAAVKAGNVEIVTYMTPNHGTSFTNEVILAFSGNAAEVKSAILEARAVGLDLLGTMNGEVKPLGVPYL